MNRCVVFDLDGTLIDSRKDLAAGINILRGKFHLPPLPLETVVSFVGNGSAKLIERSFADVPGADLDKAKKLYPDCYFATLTEHTVLYPGAADGLKRLHDAGWKLAVTSNKPQTFCPEILKRLGVLDLFGFICGGRPGLPLKPAPDVILLALEKTSSEASASWVLGDNYTDLGAGRAAGTKRAFAAWGFGNPKDEPWDFRAETFSEFAEHLLRDQPAR